MYLEPNCAPLSLWLRGVRILEGDIMKTKSGAVQKGGKQTMLKAGSAGNMGKGMASAQRRTGTGYADKPKRGKCGPYCPK